MCFISRRPRTYRVILTGRNCMTFITRLYTGITLTTGYKAGYIVTAVFVFPSPSLCKVHRGCLTVQCGGTQGQEAQV